MGSIQQPAASNAAAAVEAVELNLGLFIGGIPAAGATSSASSQPAAALFSRGERSEQQWRREYRAYRRREVRKKQEEKQMREAAGAALQKTQGKMVKCAAATTVDRRREDSGQSSVVFSTAPISVRHPKTNSDFNTPPTGTVGYVTAAAIPVMPMQCYPTNVAPYAGSTYGFPYVVLGWSAPVVTPLPALSQRPWRWRPNDAAGGCGGSAGGGPEEGCG